MPTRRVTSTPAARAVAPAAPNRHISSSLPTKISVGGSHQIPVERRDQRTPASASPQ
ncbi:MAG: hypothetical protein R2873_15510 [Caldilineaceae bacterium]